MNAVFRAIYLPALAQYAAKQDIRYYLNGFLIEPDGIDSEGGACD